MNIRRELEDMKQEWNREKKNPQIQLWMSLSTINKTSSQKISKDVKALNDTINQWVLIL